MNMPTDGIYRLFRGIDMDISMKIFYKQSTSQFYSKIHMLSTDKPMGPTYR
jgi:hypothetical protein